MTRVDVNEFVQVLHKPSLFWQFATLILLDSNGESCTNSKNRYSSRMIVSSAVTAAD